MIDDFECGCKGMLDTGSLLLLLLCELMYYDDSIWLQVAFLLCSAIPSMVTLGFFVCDPSRRYVAIW